MEKLRKCSTIKKWSFEYLYMIVMVIYACMVTPATSRMTFGLTWDIPFFIPIILTIILLGRHNVTFGNNHLWGIIGIVLIWAIAVTIKFKAFYLGFQSYNFFLVYAILVAFIQLQVYGKAFPEVYEDVMVLFAKISIPLWLFGVLLPGFASSFFHVFPSVEAITAKCYHVFYLYNWFDPATITTSEFVDLPRNSGPAFEPGFFASLLCLALLINLSRRGVVFKNNKNIWYIIIALITTFSTTGYVTAIVIFTLFFIQKGRGTNILKALFILIPLIFIISKLDFMGTKILDRANLSEINDRFIEQEAYNSLHAVDDFHSSLDRFQSLYFEWLNIKEDPILGYSRDYHYSWFGQTFISNYTLTGGLLKMIGMFGIIVGLFWYFILFKSSAAFSADRLQNQRKNALAIVLLLISISYGFFGFPVFMTFWLYGSFGPLPDVRFTKRTA